MRDFNNNRNSGGRRSGGFGGGRSGGRGGFGGGRDGGRPEMHRATCADCGESCEVPFRPTAGKPVYCNNCFKRDDGFDSSRSGGKSGGRSGGGRSGGRDFGSRGSFEEKQMHEATCAECGEICEVPFKPTNSKPVYCSECFGNKGDNKKTDSNKKDFEMLNNKLDKILKMLEIIHPKKTYVIEKVKPIGNPVGDPMDNPIVEKPAKKPAKKKVATQEAPAKKKTTKKKK